MAPKWSNLNLPAALHFVTGNCVNRIPVFTETACCNAFLEQLKSLMQLASKANCLCVDARSLSLYC